MMIMSEEIISKMKQELQDKDAVLYLFNDAKDTDAYKRLEILYDHLEKAIKLWEKNEPQKFKRI